MTGQSTSAFRVVRAGGFTLVRAAVLSLLAVFSSAALAQPVTWERLPLFPQRAGTSFVAVDFLPGEGTQADDPAADTLVAFISYGPFLYNPSGAAGAAGPNGEWGAWHPLCTSSQCAIDDGLVTAAGSFVIGGNNRDVSYSDDRGRTWTFDFTDLYPFPLFESSFPVGPAGTRAIFAGASDDGNTRRSLGDGAPETWVRAGTGLGFPQSFGEVPPSPALPNGRILMGVWNGAVYSGDGGMSYTPSNAFGQAAYIAWSFTFLPVADHPYGGVAYAGLDNLALGSGPSAEVHRSDDGGQTWALAHRFTPEETGQPEETGSNISHVVVLAGPDGALWAGVSLTNGFPGPKKGGVMRSLDGGASWERADAGFAGPDGRGYRVHQLRLSRTGVLHAATDYGVWRTTGPVVAGELSPGASSEIGVSVRPNPAGGRVEVVLTLAEAQTVRVVVVDALGREVAVVLDGAAAAGERIASVDTASWPAGVYVVRATAGAQVASARLVVAR